MTRIPTPGPIPASPAGREPTPLGSRPIPGGATGRTGTPAVSPIVMGHGTAPKSSIKDGDLSTAMEYVDFMNELGVLMQLPKRPTTASMATIADEGSAPARRRSSIVLPAIAASLVVAVAANRLLQPVPAREIPVTLRGEWVTGQGAYADRRLAFTDGAVGIAVRPGAPPALHPVRSVETTQRGDTAHLAITYEQDGERVAMSLVLVTRPARQLQLANPAGVVWRPAVDSTLPRGAGAPATQPPAAAGTGGAAGAPVGRLSESVASPPPTIPAK
ncbi:MAG: hypothetical protein U0164_07440 [Gemmatimonadaceae bacterium]